MLVPENIDSYMEDDVFVMEESLRQLSRGMDARYFSILDTLCENRDLTNRTIIIDDEVLINFDREHSPRSASDYFFSNLLIE